MRSRIVVFEPGRARRYVFDDLPPNHAEAFIRLVKASNGHFLICEASPHIAPKIPNSIRTSWYTDVPAPEPVENPHSPGCSPLKHRH